MENRGLGIDVDAPMVRRLAIALAALLAAAAPAGAAGLSRSERSTLQRHAADTWRSFDLMGAASSSLPADNVTAGGQRSGYTSPPTSAPTCGPRWARARPG